MAIYENDTIAAVSTPYGKGGVAVIRLSGSSAIEIADRVFRAKNRKPLAGAPARRAVYGDIVRRAASGEETVDDVLATVFPAPHSYTGEDTVEIACHGGVLITKTVLAVLLAAGARHAVAGEYTRRAFINGRITLSRAEALGEMLEAKNDEQLTLARAGMEGVLSDACRALYDRIAEVLTQVYACIDYPEEDLANLSREEMIERLEGVAGEIAKLSATYRTGRAIAEGIPTVICGKTNVGKSTLYNLLVGREAAIVTDIAGTTRDVLTDSISLGRVTLRLSDTAGLRETADAVEQIGVGRAKKEMEDAELIFAVFDATQKTDAEDEALIRSLAEKSVPVIPILNKCDGETRFDSSLLSSLLGKPLRISASHGEGREALAARVEALFIDEKLNTRSDAVVASARVQASLLASAASLGSALEALRADLPMDICCTDVELAMEALAEVDGRRVSEDIVSGIFSHFCVGK